MAINYMGDHAAAVTPSDTVDLAELAIRLYVGVTGNIKVRTAAKETVTFTAVPVGVFDPGVRIRQIFATDTTATSIIRIN